MFMKVIEYDIVVMAMRGVILVAKEVMRGEILVLIMVKIGVILVVKISDMDLGLKISSTLPLETLYKLLMVIEVVDICPKTALFLP